MEVDEYLRGNDRRQRAKEGADTQREKTGKRNVGRRKKIWLFYLRRWLATTMDHGFILVHFNFRDLEHMKIDSNFRVLGFC